MVTLTGKVGLDDWSSRLTRRNGIGPGEGRKTPAPPASVRGGWAAPQGIVGTTPRGIQLYGTLRSPPSRGRGGSGRAASGGPPPTATTSDARSATTTVNAN